MKKLRLMRKTDKADESVVFFDVDDTLLDTSTFAETARKAAIELMVDNGLPLDKDEAYYLLKDIIKEKGSNYDRHFNVLTKTVLGKEDPMLVALGMITYHNVKFALLRPFPKTNDTLCDKGKLLMADPIVFDTDEYPKFGASMEKMAKLKPAFKKDGVVTAANASGINDAGAALVVMSKEKADELGIKPLCTIKSYASAGVDPTIMGIGPVPSSRKALEKAGLTIDDMDLIEANEAFAAQSVAVGKELGFDTSKLNVNGGAIALGHPIGASGARILISLIYEMMKRPETKYGLATLCIGGGMGTAMVIER